MAVLQRVRDWFSRFDRTTRIVLRDGAIVLVASALVLVVTVSLLLLHWPIVWAGLAGFLFLLFLFALLGVIGGIVTMGSMYRAS